MKAIGDVGLLLWLVVNAAFQPVISSEDAGRSGTVGVSALAGTKVTLPCCPLLRENVQWSVSRKSSFNEIAINGVVLHGYSDNFYIGKTAEGCYNLIVSRAALTDSGLYRCTEDNGLNKTHYVRLAVRDNTSMTASAGEKVVLPCRLSNVESEILWRFNGTTSTNRSRVVDIVVDSRIPINLVDRFRCDDDETRLGRCSLVIFKAQPSDTGNYACMDDNGAGQAYYIYLNVLTSLTTTTLTSDTTTALKEVDNPDQPQSSSATGVVVGLIIALIFTILAAAVIIAILVRRKRRQSSQQKVDQQETQTKSATGNSDVSIPLVDQQWEASERSDERRLTLSNIESTYAQIPRETSDTTSLRTLDVTTCKTLVKSGTAVHYFIVLRDKFFLVRRDKMIIEAYSYGEAFEWKYEIGIKHIIKPSGFTQSECDNCLYLGDRQNRCIHRITPHDEGGTTHVWVPPFKDAHETVQSLSVLPDGRLAVLVAIQAPTDKSWKGRIDIYLSTVKAARFERTFAVPKFAENPWSFTVAENDTFVITYGHLEFGMVRLQADGESVANCTETIINPRSIRYDPVTNCVFVALPGERKIKQFNMKLEPVAVVKEWNSKAGSTKSDTQPMGMQFYRDEGDLYMLVGMESGMVTLFKLNDQLARASSTAT